MSEDDSAARLDLWWQGLTAEEQSEFRDLKMGDPFPRKHLSAYSRANLVVGAQGDGQQGVDHRVNERLGAFLARRRGEQD